MNQFQRYGNLVKSDGTNQFQRLLPGLERDYVRPDERGLSGLVRYAQSLASELRYHNSAGGAIGDWASMFEGLLDSNGDVFDDSALSSLKAQSDSWPPHLALFFAFLRSFGAVQNDLNELPRRHLEFFYDEYLQIQRRGVSPDRVHVVFELARNAEDQLLPAGTRIDAGADEEGRLLTYELERDLVVTHAKIADVRRLVTDRDNAGRHRFFKSDSPPEGSSWATFGVQPFGASTSTDPMEEVDVGFALASPQFRLAEGDREISIVAELDVGGMAPSPRNLGASVRVELTGAEGWFQPQTVEATLLDRAGTFEFRIAAKIGRSQPAVVDFDEALHGGPGVPVAQWPLLRLLIRPESGVIDSLEGFSATDCEIEVSAAGLEDLTFENDIGKLVAGKPIEPFGPHPKLGARFYIGSREVFSKRLSHLAIHFDWQELPTDWFDRYEQYFDIASSNGHLEAMLPQSFTMRFDLLDGRSWDHLLAPPLPMFDVGSKTRSISISDAAIVSAFEPGEYRRNPEMPEPEAYTTTTQRGFLRLTLDSPENDDLTSPSGLPYALDPPFTAFGHDAFQPRFSTRALEIAHWDGTGAAPELPKEPYTPTLAGVTVDYSSRERFSIGDIHAPERFFTIDAFGYTAAGHDVPALLVPAFEGQAALFLGFENLAPPANLSLLFQLDEGTTHVGSLLDSNDVSWLFLEGDQWHALPATAVLADETRGFQRSGVVTVSMGPDASRTHTAMPGGLTWLQARISKPPESAARTVDVRAQAATARFAPANHSLPSYSRHLERGLPPHSATKLKSRRSAIRKVEQPFPSFGGKQPESDRSFFQRSSERLRHRRRAVTAWDFERLVLDKFSEVFKVKCIPNVDALAEPRVGDAAVVIIPNLLRSRVARLEPQAGEVLMAEIRRFIEDRLRTPFADVHVIHPVFERVLVEARVAFREGFDPGFYAEKLNQDLQRFLSPWAFEEGQDIVFGARIYRSELLKFMEDQTYVDYITHFEMYHSFGGTPLHGIGSMTIGSDFIIGTEPTPAIGEMVIGTDFVVGNGVEMAMTTRPHAILVSHPEHRIEPMIPGTEQCTGVSQLGIGYMTVGLDFEIHPG